MKKKRAFKFAQKPSAIVPLWGNDYLSRFGYQPPIHERETDY